jgi:hypothetical protein
LRVISVFVLLATLLAGIPAFAQSPETDPVSRARLRWGIAAVTPRISVTNLGVDTNVFNSSAEPTRDLTTSINPAADTFLRLGRGLVTSNTELSWNYYAKSSGQRDLGRKQQLRLEFDLVRISPYVIGDWSVTRQRPNADIDQRVSQHRTSAGGGVRVRVGPRLHGVIETNRSRLSYGLGQFGDREIASALDRVQQEHTVSLNYAQSSVTTLVLKSSLRHDRFSSALRDSDSFTLAAGAEFGSQSQLSGRAMVGYRHFDPKLSSLPDYRGPQADVAISYLLRELTRLDVTVSRNLDYSIDDDAPYMLGTAGVVSVSQVVAGAWYAIIRGGKSSFRYRAIPRIDEDGNVLDASRSDRIVTYGLGVGRRLGDNARMEVVSNYVRRLSSIRDRQYSGVKLGGAVLYGF